MKTKQPEGQLARVSTLGGLLGIKTGPLLPRLAPIASACDDKLLVTVDHGFDALTVTTTVARDAALAMCGAWLDALPGDTIDLAVGATTLAAFSDEAALPSAVPALVHSIGADLATLGFDGTAWTYVMDQANATDDDVAATIARFDRAAAQLGVTTAQREIAATLHRSLARTMTTRTWLRTREGALEPRVGIVWDEVEWTPLQSMLKGFYPKGGGVEKIARLSRAIDAEHATVELILGPTDPPALRFTFPLV